jgi:hypothetical protein
MDPTGAFALVALQKDWDNHPKNIIPGTPAVGGAAAIRVDERCGVLKEWRGWRSMPPRGMYG